MKTKFSLLALGLALPCAAMAGLINIAQVPLLNITGTGSVKPNLMLLFDNSGSMAWAYTPDYVHNENLCRSGATLAAGTTACDNGHPPYNSGDFNKQYYNPLVLYQVPVKADGSYYNSMNSANTTAWTHVPDDAFASSVSYTNLVTGFPDLEWCNGAGVCKRNATTGTYTYPDNTYTNSNAFGAAPYYYSIGVAEYCTDSAMTTCQSVALGAAAPPLYPVAAKVRWCSSTALTTCQAKRVGGYIYPKYSGSSGAAVPPTALITITGNTSGSSPTPSLASVKLGATTLFSGGLTLGKNKSPSTVVTTIKNKINAGAAFPGVTAYSGGNAITPTCAAQGAGSVCIVDSGASADGAAVTLGTYNGATLSTTAAAGYTASLNPFQRTDIVSTRASYPKGSARTDCAASACTYAEEMTNFANWHAYYQTRLQMMKTSVGLAFAPLGGNFRVGYFKLSNAGAVGAVDLKPADFSGTARSTWYTTLYNTSTTGSTPMRPAMDSVGKMYANLSPYNYAAGSEVVQYPCQQNFTIVTTDGYWNGGSAASVSNNDNTDNPARFCTAARGCVDTRAQSSPSISDVALYWYNGGSNSSTVSLRPTLEPDMSKPGMVPAAAGENTHLHMNTYTLGLGVDGVMNYEANYDTAPRVGGDFYNLITSAASGCQWNGGGAYVWPNPNTGSTASTVQERVDDLWHAAVNGHGKYFSASAPSEVVAGLSAAIANMSVHVGAAAAAATSTPNISQQDNDIFSDTFTTVKWYGELSDKKIDVTTGIVGDTPVWVSSDTVGQKVAASSDTRALYMLDTAGAPALKNFSYDVMTATERAWFDNKCASLSQCSLLSAAGQAIVNSGANLVDWLRGQQQYGDDQVFRAYTLTSNTPAGAAGPVPIVLGDIASSKPAFLRDPRKFYSLAGYADYKVANAARAATVFTAANDGMLHAFNAANGDELWAYAPRITMKKLYAQASTTYGTNHQYTTDGSPELGDVQIGGAWRTVLVAGLNGGGRGYYALDVTEPTAPKALWELCADATCAKSDGDLGLTFGNPQFGMWNGKWVVYLTSGYNNVPGVEGVASGDGLGYLYIVDVADGTVLRKISTGAGGVTTPSGLAKITSISANPATDPLTTYIYGGDNQGKMWRFDLTDVGTHAVTRLLMGDAGALQPITTRPDVSSCRVESVAADGSVSAAAQRVVLFGTGRLLDVPDTSNVDVQSLYLLKDGGATIGDIRGATMVEQTLGLLGSGSNINSYGVSANAVDLSVRDGWFLDWKLNAGERMNLDPKIVNGGVSAVTNIPTSSSACSVGGSSNVYQVALCSGSHLAADTIAGGTLSNTSAAVGFIIIRLPSGALKMISTTAAGNTITTGVASPNSQGARKAGWRRVNN